ncbi:MAG: HAD family phosphatase, partial [Clostridia bacterium]|nr:HAD family phosphatase [Clostridia bacterium]
MKKFEGILFCTDLDGTLYTKDKKVSKENLEAIEYFKKEGGKFTFITGRVHQTSEEIFNTIKPNAPYGCLNGGGIYDGENKKYLWNMLLPKEALELVCEVDKKIPQMGIQVCTKKEVIFSKESAAMEYFRQVTGVPDIRYSYKDVKDPILKVVLGSVVEEEIIEVSKLLNSHPKAKEFDFIRSEKRLYEILPKGANKGLALEKLAEILGISMEKTIAVGDYDNDVSMVKRAGVGFAVSNAVEDVKAAADYITVSNEESAIAKIIDMLDKGEILD